MREFKERKKQLRDVEEYVAKVGAPQPHLPNQPGEWFDVKVLTKIHHQPSPAAQNYHESFRFDEVLSEVIFSRIEELSNEAVKLAKQRVAESVSARREEIEAELRELELAEKGDACEN